MIKSFADRETEDIFKGIVVKRLASNLQVKVLRRLRYIDAAQTLDDLRVPPSNKLEKKTGSLRNFYAIWVNSQWRIIFKWVDNAAYEVQLVDYH